MTAPMFRITMTIEGDKVVDRMLAGIEERARDLTGAWPKVIEIFRQINAQAFASEGASTDDGRWPELAETTQAERQRKGFGAAHPILQRTGKLRRALTLEENNLVTLRPTSLRYQLSPEVDYYVYHQSRAPRTRLPRRAPVSLTADQRTELMHPIRLWITGRDPDAQRREAVR
jgi:phage gpG-like protein